MKNALDRRSFNKAISQRVFSQLLTLAPGLALYLLATVTDRGDLQILACIFTIIAVIVRYFFIRKQDIFRRRLAAIFPEQEVPGGYFEGHLVISPLVAAALWIYLLIQNDQPKFKKMPWILRRTINATIVATLMGVGLPLIGLVAGLHANTLWVSEPGVSYLTSMLTEADYVYAEVKRERELPLDDQYTLSPELKTSLPSMTGVIGMWVPQTNRAVRLKDKLSFNAAVKNLLTGTLDVAAISNQQRPALWRFNPLAAFSVVSAGEVLAITAIDAAVELNAYSKFVALYESKIEEFEKAKAISPVESREFNSALRNTRVYKIQHSAVFFVNRAPASER